MAFKRGVAYFNVCPLCIAKLCCVLCHILHASCMLHGQLHLSWLQRGLFFSDLSSEESRKLFKKFVSKWNSQSLDRVSLVKFGGGT